MQHQSVTSLDRILLFLFLRLVPSIFSSISSFCVPFPRIKCPKYCGFLSCIVLRSVFFASAVSKTTKLVFLSKYHILNMRRKFTSQTHWFYLAYTRYTYRRYMKHRCTHVQSTNCERGLAQSVGLNGLGLFNRLPGPLLGCIILHR